MASQAQNLRTTPQPQARLTLSLGPKLPLRDPAQPPQDPARLADSFSFWSSLSQSPRLPMSAKSLTPLNKPGNHTHSFPRHCQCQRTLMHHQTQSASTESLHRLQGTRAPPWATKTSWPQEPLTTPREHLGNPKQSGT